MCLARPVFHHRRPGCRYRASFECVSGAVCSAPSSVPPWPCSPTSGSGYASNCEGQSDALQESAPPPYLCESGFERQVFFELVTRGYRVIPQVKTGAYRIDMVVEGLGDVRLAVECDGDEYHGPDRWQHDMNRQRVLERAGWVFWRCFASTWMLRRDEVLSELLERLYGMGIEPLGAMERMPSLVEKRVWRCPEPEIENRPEPQETQAL